MIIWRAYANGQIGRGGEAENATTHKNSTNNIIGPYKKETPTDKGNGSQIEGICRGLKMIPTATWGKPWRESKDKWKTQSKVNEANTEWWQEMKNKYTPKWSIPDGQIQRKVDYIMINENTEGARTARNYQ